jgi:hypothetical protein
VNLLARNAGASARRLRRLKNSFDLEAGDDKLVEVGGLEAQRGDTADDSDRDGAGNDGVFDGGGAALVSRQIQSRSRSIGMSGTSAGGIG